MPTFQIKHRRTGATLYECEAESLRQCVEAAVMVSANLSGANLSGANLSGASLSGASLSGAYLHGATLYDAYLSGAGDVIDAGQPNGWSAFGWHKDGVIQVKVGCRDKTLAEGREYWAGKLDRAEIMAALDYIETVAKLRNWPLTS